MPFTRRVKITVREFGAQDGSSPATNGVTEPPLAGTTQISNVPASLVKTIVFPSGDQSGSVQLPAPAVPNRRIDPPFAETKKRADVPSAREEKQIVWPSGDQQGEDSASLVLVNCFKLPVSASHT